LQAIGTKDVGENDDGIPATAVVYGEDMYLSCGFNIGPYSLDFKYQKDGK
jgi:hypothetical protein